MLWLPGASDDVLNVAFPALFRSPGSQRSRGCDRSARKVTAPVGVPAPGAAAVIVAVRVTAWPKVADWRNSNVVMSALDSLSGSTRQKCWKQNYCRQRRTQ